MKKTIILAGILAVTGSVKAQNAIDAYSISQPDMKGTARFMGMAGAFGALGGDLTAISQNPAGIGVYRSSDIGFTLDLDLQKARSTAGMLSNDMDQTKFLLNNMGAVLTLRMQSSTFPNFNFGFTYNKGASFNRRYGGNIGNLHTSMSNYIAAIAESDGVTEGDVWETGGVDPYNPGFGYYQAPWITILGAQTGVILPQYNQATDKTKWYGMWQDSMNGNDTSGTGTFAVEEKGGINEFNIVIGGNILDKLYWGMNFSITNVNYRMSTYWGESLMNAYGIDSNGKPFRENLNWNLNSGYTLSGTGFNYQLGLIFKPVQQFRLGFAFHTPTWYSLNEEFIGMMNYNGEYGNVSNTTNYGVPGYNSYNFRTPWKIIASAAGVISDKLIVSFDYEWANYGNMHFSEPSTYYDDWYYDDWNYPMPYSASAGGPIHPDFIDPNDPYGYENYDIKSYYKSTNTFRVGLEFKPVSSLSIRAGYSYVSSPVKSAAKNNDLIIYTAALTPSYRFDNTTNYITFGLGYRYQHVYVDLAYVLKKMDSEFHAYSPDPDNKYVINAQGVKENLVPQAKLNFTNNQIVLSAGYRF